MVKFVTLVGTCRIVVQIPSISAAVSMVLRLRPALVLLAFLSAFA